VSSVTLTSIPKLASNVHSNVTLERVFIFVEDDDSRYMEIDGLAFELWRGIDGHRNLNDLIGRLIRNKLVSETHKTKLESDTLALFNELLTLKLIEIKA
jgi:hypothetical protein